MKNRPQQNRRDVIFAARAHAHGVTLHTRHGTRFISHMPRSASEWLYGAPPVSQTLALPARRKYHGIFQAILPASLSLAAIPAVFTNKAVGLAGL
jgi:hypothetical protein